MRKQNWFGCLICGAAVVPAFLIGGLAAVLYTWTMSAELGTDPDFYFMHTLFGIETPGKVLTWTIYSAFPAFIRGAVAGSIAAFSTHYAYKGPKLDLAVFVTGGLFTGVAAMSEFLSYVMHGPDLSMLLIVIEAVGLWVGLLSVANSYSTPESSLV
jgi:hypothetical protein